MKVDNLFRETAMLVRSIVIDAIELPVLYLARECKLLHWKTSPLVDAEAFSVLTVWLTYWDMHTGKTRARTLDLVYPAWNQLAPEMALMLLNAQTIHIRRTQTPFLEATYPGYREWFQRYHDAQMEWSHQQAQTSAFIRRVLEFELELHIQRLDEYLDSLDDTVRAREFVMASRTD